MYHAHFRGTHYEAGFRWGSLPFEKVVRNIIRAKFLRPGIRAYRTENIYAPFAGPGAGKEDVIEKHKEKKRSRQG